MAFKIGEKTDDPLAMYLTDICTIPVNLAALPGIASLPGFSQGLPVGLQIIGPHFSEKGMLEAANAMEHKFGLDLLPPIAEVAA